MFTRFASSARAAVVEAQDEARRLEHGYVGTEHLLLGVLARGAAGAALLHERAVTREDVLALHDIAEVTSLDPEALATLGIDLAEVRSRVERTFGPGALALRGRCRRPRIPGSIPFTPCAKKALELALREALRRGHKEIRDEHLILGLLAVEDGLAARLLAEHGLRLNAARALVEGRSAA